MGKIRDSKDEQSSDNLFTIYNKIRSLLRYFYVYGCFNKEDYLRIGIKNATIYDQDIKKIPLYIPKEMYHKNKQKGGSNAPGISYVMERIEYNYFLNTYRSHSFTNQQIRVYLYALENLPQYEEEPWTDYYAVKEYIDKYRISDSIAESGVNSNLKDYITAGIIVEQENGLTLCRDYFKEFSDEELKSLYNYSNYMRNTSPFSTPYHFLAEKLRLYMQCERKIEMPEQIFQYKHEHLFRVVEDEVVFAFLQSIYKDVQCEVETNGKKRTVTPAELVYNAQDGRWYAISFDSKGNALISRLDKIGSVQCDAKPAVGDKEQLIKRMEHVWAISEADKKTRLKEVKIKFIVDEKFILDRLNREGRLNIKDSEGAFVAKLEKMSEDEYIYSTEVTDPHEMVPWIRSFGQRAQVLEPQNLAEYISNDWKAALKKYEGCENGTV